MRPACQQWNGLCLSQPRAWKTRCSFASTRTPRDPSRYEQKRGVGGFAKSAAPLFIVWSLSVSIAIAQSRNRVDGRYGATAYSSAGQTASGDMTHRRIVAADPTILPLGSRIRITAAGRYSGEYTVEDTGSKIHGRQLDIFIPNHAEARRFGKRSVRVKVLGVTKPAKRVIALWCRTTVRLPVRS